MIKGCSSEQILSKTNPFYSDTAEGSHFSVLLVVCWHSLGLSVQSNVGFALISFKTVLSSLRTVVSPVVVFQYLSYKMSLYAAQERVPSILTPMSKIATNDF